MRLNIVHTIQHRLVGKIKTSWRRSLVEYVLLCCVIGVTVWSYYGTLDDFFIMDDFERIEGSSTVQQFWWHLLHGFGGNFYRPLDDLLFIWDFYWWKWTPVGWHLTNLLLHLVTILLVYKLTKTLTQNGYAGVIASGVFGLHPGNTEPVVWISIRTDILCTIFFLLSMYTFIVSHQTDNNIAQPNARNHRRISAYIWSLIWFIAALMTKEMAVTLPLLIVVYDLIFATRLNLLTSELWKKIKLYAPYFLLLIGYFLFRAFLFRDQFGSGWRSSVGGYEISLFGSFLLENFVWYFQHLTTPFWVHILASLVWVNLTKIAIVTLILLVISKQTRFATLWIWITLLPVCFARLQRGIYPVSVGFGILFGLAFTYSLPQTSKFFSDNWRKWLQPALRTLQILLFIGFLYQYGIAKKETNAWWNGVADINERVPLLAKALYPVFPDDAKVCFQNVPTVFNQRFSRAFDFRYPESRFDGVYTDEFEVCAENESAEDLQKMFFLYYINQTLFDMTYEIRETLRARFMIHNTDLDQDPHHILTKQTTHFSATLPQIGPCKKLGLVTSLANGSEITQGAIVAQGHIEGTDGKSIPFELITGVNTAEWAFRFPSLANAVKHAMPQVYRAWTLGQPDETIRVAQNYISYVELPLAFTPQTLVIDLAAPSDGPSNLALDLGRVILYTTAPKEGSDEM